MSNYFWKDGRFKVNRELKEETDKLHNSLLQNIFEIK